MGQNKGKKRILMIAACPFPGNRGTPSRILKMSEALARKGYDIDVLTYYNRDFEYKGNLIKIHRVKKIPFYNDNSPGPKIMKPIADLFLIIKGKKLLKEYNYSLIHAHHLEGGICGIILRKSYKIPLVYDSHVIIEEESKFYKKFNFNFIRWILIKIENLCYLKSSGIVYVAQEAKDYINRKHALNKNQLVLPTGTNIDEILIMIKRLRNPFSQKNCKKAVYTGSIAKYQNVEDIIEVAKLCRNEKIKFYIVTGANKNEGDYLQNKIKLYRLSNVSLIFNSSFKEQIAYAKYSDILLSPRHFLGGIPQKITNYAVLKKKIVATYGSVKILDESTGYLYKGGDINDFYKKLKFAMKDSKSIKENSAFLIVKKYDWDYLVNKLDNFYEELI